MTISSEFVPLFFGAVIGLHISATVLWIRHFWKDSEFLRRNEVTNTGAWIALVVNAASFGFNVWALIADGWLPINFSLMLMNGYLMCVLYTGIWMRNQKIID